MDLQLGISELARFLRECPTADATAKFDVLSDGLVWSDEYPDDKCVSDEAELVFRYLLKFRTSKIEGHPIEALVPLWNDATTAFPNWPGFSPERTISTPEMLEVISDGREKQEKFFGDA